MDTGLLLLRLVVGALIFGHGAQKAFGAFGGLGPAGTAPLFETWGFRPGRTMVLLAATCELLASSLLLLGLATPLAAAISLGTLTVAASVNVANGLWAVKGGFELPLLYAVVAGSFAFLGPGAWSLDAALDLNDEYGTASGLVAVAVGLLVAGVFIQYARHRRTHPVTA